MNREVGFRHGLFRLSIVAVFFGVACVASAAEWRPTQPLKLIVHTAPGGGADLFARYVGDLIRETKLLGVPVEVTNRPGGGGGVAISFAHERRGDASYLMCVTNVLLTTPLSQKGLPTYKDFTPVAVMAHDTNAVHVNAASPYRTTRDLIEAARARPGTITHAFGAFGGTDHIIGFQLGKAAGVQFNYVAFKGGGEATVALLGGHVDFVTGNPSETREHVEAGKLRVLGIVGDRRLAVFPEVPTLKEQGFNVEGTYAVFRGFVGPPGVPQAAVDAYAAVLRKVMDMQRWKRYVTDNQLIEEFIGPSAMPDFLDERNAKLAQALAEIARTK
jgi:putative tricarboxylic transport membrane protein